MGTIVLFSDISCPWAHLCVYRLLSTRARLGLDDEVTIDHHCFPLELLNRRPTSRSTLDSEIPVIAGLDPEAGFQMWQGAPDAWPATVLPAMEAVQAAKEQSLRASEALDRALRLALFAESRCISLHHVILDVAANTPGVDADALERDLVSGRARARVFEDFEASQTDRVKGSPHVFVEGGPDFHNPGIEMQMHGEHGKGGFPVIVKDDPSVYETMMMTM